MRLHGLKLRFLAALGALGLADAVASAQGCGPGGCGPTLSYGSSLGGDCGSGCVGNGTALFSPDRPTRLRRPDGTQPACATRTYPISDWLYIRKYCGPSIIPGTCFGHFQPKWRRWQDVCPDQGEPDVGCGVQPYGEVLGGAPVPGPGTVIPPGTPGPALMPTPTPLPPGTTPLPSPTPLVPGLGSPVPTTPGTGGTALPAPATPSLKQQPQSRANPQGMMPRLQPVTTQQIEQSKSMVRLPQVTY